MNYLEEIFMLDLISNLSGKDEVTLFNRQVLPNEIFPVGSPLRDELFNRWKIYKGGLYNNRLKYLGSIGENRHRITELSILYNINEVIPFVGAGLSVPSGLMSWFDLLNDLANMVTQPRISTKIKTDISNGKYEEAADEIYKRLGKRSFDEKLENRYKVIGQADIEGSIKLLPGIFQNLIITTNFDNIIELLLEKYDETSPKIQGKELENAEIDGLIDTRILIKLHGDHRKASTRILIKSEYDHAYSSRKFKSAISAIAKAKSILFLGCSLIDDRYLKTIKTVSYGDLPRRNYAIVKPPFTDKSAEYYKWITREDNRLNRLNIFPIWVDKYEDIDVILFTLLKLQTEEMEQL